MRTTWGRRPSLENWLADGFEKGWMDVGHGLLRAFPRAADFAGDDFLRRFSCRVLREFVFAAGLVGRLRVADMDRGVFRGKRGFAAGRRFRRARPARRWIWGRVTSAMGRSHWVEFVAIVAGAVDRLGGEFAGGMASFGRPRCLFEQRVDLFSILCALGRRDFRREDVVQG